MNPLKACKLLQSDLLQSPPTRMAKTQFPKSNEFHSCKNLPKLFKRRPQSGFAFEWAHLNECNIHVPWQQMQALKL